MRLYYKIELRMGEWILPTVENEDIEDLEGELFYYSDGYMIIEGDVIQGFLSNDLITGDLTENEIFIEILEDDEEYINYSSFVNEFDGVEFPGEYLLMRQDIEGNQFAVINFIETISDISKQKKIEEQLKLVKKIHTIP